MELLQLRYLLEVAKTEHMTKAAQNLNVSQPVLSRSITKLEEELGVPLFDRVGRGIKLNDCGKLFRKNISTVIKLLDYSIQEVQNFEKDGVYEIAICVAAIAELSTHLICDFAEKHPNIVFYLIQNETHKNWNKDGEYDLLITSSWVEDESVNSITLFSEEIALGVSVNNPLSQYDSISLKQVENENFIDRLPDNNFRHLTDSFCRKVGIKRNISIECDSPQMLLSLIESGMGVGFVGCKAVSNEGIKLLHITDLNCERFIELQWRENYYKNKGVLEFIAYAQKYFENYR